MGRPRKKSRTTLVRIFEDDKNELISRGFLGERGVSSAEFFRLAIKTNPFLQAESLLRPKVDTKRNRSIIDEVLHDKKNKRKKR